MRLRNSRNCKQSAKLFSPYLTAADDGYSGTSTSRPAFQRLIQDAQDGKVKTIIVKDFSRFVRDYIEAGDYMERIFHCWAFDSSLSTMGMTVECRPGTMYADWK